MSDVRTFRAPSMQAALDIVRQEMGADAVILHTRQLEQRRWLPWGKVPQEVEITAGLGVNIPPLAVRKPSIRPRPPRAAAPASAAGTVSNAAGFQSVSDTGRTLGGGSAMFERMSSEGDTLTVSRRPSVVAPQAAPVFPVVPQRPRIEHPDTTAFASKLDSIQKMLEQLGRSQQFVKHDEIPDELFHLYTELIDVEVEDELARTLVDRLRRECSPQQLANAAAARNTLTAMVESQVRVCGPISVVPGARKVVALIGSTGVGKTTTIAKLAANFRLRDGIKMGLVTVDTYRIAAVEQLRTYAEIIDLPMKVVTSPQEMRRALDELIGLDLVLIDTAGRSPRDELQIHELNSLLADASVDEVHLVLSMTSSVRTLAATAEKFASAGTTSLILTKLDEAAGLGSVLSLSKKVPLPISYLTTGQDVPDDIEPATASRIARLVLGQERLNA